MNKVLFATLCVISIVAGKVHSETWDMPMAYSASNFHSEHGAMFAKKVSEYSEKYAITVHSFMVVEQMVVR